MALEVVNKETGEVAYVGEELQSMETDLEVFDEDVELPESELLGGLREDVEPFPVAPVPAQLSLDVALFAAYHVPEVLVSVSASDKMSVGELKRLLMGQPIGPGKDVLVTLAGYVGGAGLKWKPDGAGKGAVLSIVGDKVHHITVLNPLETRVVDQDALGAVARGWTHDENSAKELDGDLAAAIAEEITPLLEELRGEREEARASVQRWTDVAAEYAKNEAFYRDLLDQVAVHLGVDAYTDDEGEVHEEPIRLKIPELVEKKIDELMEYVE